MDRGGAISPPHSDILQTQTFFLLDKAGGSLCNSSSSAMFWSDGAQISLPLSISYDIIISDNVAASLETIFKSLRHLCVMFFPIKKARRSRGHLYLNQPPKKCNKRTDLTHEEFRRQINASKYAHAHMHAFNQLIPKPHEALRIKL